VGNEERELVREELWRLVRTGAKAERLANSPNILKALGLPANSASATVGMTARDRIRRAFQSIRGDHEIRDAQGVVADSQIRKAAVALFGLSHEWAGQPAEERRKAAAQALGVFLADGTWRKRGQGMDEFLALLARILTTSEEPSGATYLVRNFHAISTVDARRRITRTEIFITIEALTEMQFFEQPWLYTADPGAKFSFFTAGPSCTLVTVEDAASGVRARYDLGNLQAGYVSSFMIGVTVETEAPARPFIGYTALHETRTATFETHFEIPPRIVWRRSHISGGERFVSLAPPKESQDAIKLEKDVARTTFDDLRPGHMYAMVWNW
jgi:hypothetical protein